MHLMLTPAISAILLNILCSFEVTMPSQVQGSLGKDMRDDYYLGKNHVKGLIAPHKYCPHRAA